MKRVADNQLTKDDDGDSGDDVQEVSQGFQKADESVLATRQIRALPKRSLAGAAAKATSFNGFGSAPTPAAAGPDKEAPTLPKFASFAGFGSSTPSSPFTFTVQPPPTAPTPPTAPSSAAGFNFHSTLKPPQSSTSSDSPNGTLPTQSTHSTGGVNGDATVLKYYKSLRGLNVSFLSAISKAIEQDPFADVTGLLESYKNLRMTVQSEFDNSSKHSTTSSSTPGPSAITTETPAPVSQFAMPKPPSAFPGLPATASTSTSDNRFSVTPAVKASPFSFSLPTTSSSTAPSFGPSPKANDPSAQPSSSASEPPKSAFTFGTSKADDSNTSKPSFFAFGTTGSLSSKQNPFDSSTNPSEISPFSAFKSSPDAPKFFATSKVPSTTSDIGAKTTTTFGTSTSIFGSNVDGGKPPLCTPSTGCDITETGDKVDASKEPPKTFATSLFGGSFSGNPSSSPTAGAFSSEQPISVFGASPQKPSVFGFGKPAGSIGNPVGFGFGALAPKAGDSGGPTNSLRRSPAVSPPPTEKSGESTPQPEANEETPPAEDDPAKSLTTATHDEEGEGEEDEETVHVVKCKIFKLTKTDDKNEWKDLGIGMLRLKKHKENNTRRVLMRNSHTGRILLNFRLFSGLKPSLAKTSVAFVGHENGAPASYRIRVKTESQAVSLKDAMDREIAASQATS
ncbi:hypothetical protein BKA82DRAFT_21862 [Pisolithus tinctorius]|uniref:RanBD1 domain-containing protein n=1 Tax=Pisolithus tinctorius Marx 270 TaxID=870435 RepID=A0A0C3KKR9_PISTI|nr:hypothetical protein BKA82DRAFT_21862 [Pisolithus tinctorius]KIO10197.1 hypothetical protein M404DRAFT_21862 [Pisolithus tinctorius Marx 270]